MKGQIHSELDTQKSTAKPADDLDEWLARAQSSGERISTIDRGGVQHL